MEFGEILKELRRERKLGIKRLAPDLGVSYSYLSKLENARATPSDDLLLRVSAYFDYDSSRLFLSASRIPPEVLTILREHPDEAVTYLRERFGQRHERPAARSVSRDSRAAQ